MKFILALSALFLASSASAASVSSRAGSKFGNGGFGGATAKKGGTTANKGSTSTTANKGGNNASASKATASTTAAAAAASSAAASGNNNQGSGNNGTSSSGNDTGDAQTSLTLLQSVIATGFEKTGQDAADNPAAGQVASITSSNNFINFCATVPNLPITNGKQIKTGSCNPAPMGVIIAQTNMPASKFVFPQNFQAIKANTAFTIQMGIKNLVTGNFVNAQTNYYSAPQQVDSTGTGIGHSHFVIEDVGSFTSTSIPNNVDFAFFQGVNTAAADGVLSVAVTAGLPTGTYRLASINAAANHQPVLVAVAQHGSMDDMVYFEVTDDGQASSANPGASAGTGAAAGTGTGTNSTGTGAAAGTGTGTNSTGNTGANTGKGKGSNNAGGNTATAAATAATTAAAAADTTTAAAATASSASSKGSTSANKGSTSTSTKGATSAKSGSGGFGAGKAGAGKFGKGKRFEGFARTGLNRL